MASKVGIANKALTLLGDQPITALTDDTERGRAVNRIYDETVREMLSEHPWGFAQARASIAADTTGPTHTYARYFSFPSDALRITEVDTSYLYSIEGRKIATDETAPLAVVYISDVSDPNQMPPYFRRALSFRLAAELSFTITGNATLVSAMQAQADRELALARAFDSQENGQHQQSDGSWLEARL